MVKLKKQLASKGGAEKSQRQAALFLPKGNDPSGGNNNKSTKTDSTSSSNSNKPRNVMVMDATTPLQFAWQGRYNIHQSITVHQRPDEDTWPGGAVWDLGWCMGQLLVGLSTTTTCTTTTTAEGAGGGGGKATTITTTTTITATGETRQKSTSRRIELPVRLTEALLRIHHNNSNSFLDNCNLVLELGCGVGLTGLIAAAALRAKATVLTDLQVVIEKITQPNVELNSTGASSSKSKLSLGSTTTVVHTINKGHGQVVAMPLCWGNADDEQAVANVLQQLSTTVQSTTSRHYHHQQFKGKGPKKKIDTATTMTSTTRPDPPTTTTISGCSRYYPDLVLIGDVAYQHKPGAPSHFEALVSTLLQFVDDHTLIMFGTRIRMPASVDLLDMLLQHCDEIVQPAIAADEIDAAAFFHVKHNMSIHFLMRKKSSLLF